jgi:hypothetical protein
MAPGGLGARHGGADLGYNVAACEHGYVMEGRGPYRAGGANGTGDANARYASLVYIGGPGDDLPEAGERAIREAITYLVNAGFPAKAKGHRDFVSTECPGDRIYSKLPELFRVEVPSIEEASAMIRNPAVDIAVTRSGQGYYVLARDGAVFSYGDAQYLGGRGGLDQENAPFVAIEITSSGLGYWLVGADGGIFSYGDAVFYGSLGNQKVTSPVRSFKASPTGLGYVMVTEGGQVFPFGDLVKHGEPVEHLA